MVGERPGPYVVCTTYRHLPRNVIGLSATVGLVYINLWAFYLESFQTISEVRKKLELGHRPPQPGPGKNFWTGSEFLFVATCVSDLTFLAI